MTGWAGSEHATRIIPLNEIVAGYLYAWLSSEYGKQLITRYAYGSVILEIDKEMLASVPVPLLQPADQAHVAQLVLQANGLRNDAWQKEQKALRRLEEILTLQEHVHSECGFRS
jgi:type I restriction enzyme S subunit